MSITFKWKLAVNYALKHWDGGKEFEPDCTSFVSYCWRTAGIPEGRVTHDPTDGWYFDNRFNNNHASAWKNVGTFHNWMVNIKQYCDKLPEDGYASWHEKAELGDVIQFYNPFILDDDDAWYHSAIITKIEKGLLGNKYLYFAAHSYPRRCKDLAWTLRAGKVRLLHIKDQYRSDEGELDDPNPPTDNFGEIDDIITKVQKALNRYNNPSYYCGRPEDGIQGPQTTEAVKAFQRDHGLYADGVVGNETLKALGITRL